MDFILKLIGSETCGLFPLKVAEKILLDPFSSVVGTLPIFSNSVPLCHCLPFFVSHGACLGWFLWFHFDDLMQ